jgi:hypothetical protein
MRTEAYCSFIGMNMARKNNIDLVFNKPGFKLHSHTFPFHIVVVVTVIQW